MYWLGHWLAIDKRTVSNLKRESSLKPPHCFPAVSPGTQAAIPRENSDSCAHLNALGEEVASLLDVRRRGEPAEELGEHALARAHARRLQRAIRPSVAQAVARPSARARSRRGARAP